MIIVYMILTELVNRCGELDLICKKIGRFPKIFLGSFCEEINEGEFFNTYRKLSNPCTDAGFVISQNVTVKSCYVCSSRSTDRSNRRRRVVTEAAQGINLDLTFPCINGHPDLFQLSCRGPHSPEIKGVC